MERVVADILARAVSRDRAWVLLTGPPIPPTGDRAELRCADDFECFDGDDHPADTIARPRVCGGTTQVFLHGLAEA